MKRITSLTLFVCSLFLVFGSAQSAYACRAEFLIQPGESVPSRRGNITGNDFNEFAYVLDSAGDWYCYSSGAQRLKQKLQAFKTYHDGLPAGSQKDWQKWLSGGSVSMVMASGLWLGTFGALDAELDALIMGVAKDYAFDTTFNGMTGGFTGTNWTEGNTHLEDYAMDASAQAWIAAYLRNTGRAGWSGYRTASINAMKSMLNPATTCIRKFSGTINRSSGGPCNGSYADLIAMPPTGEIVTLNRKEQAIAYGIGQMTSFGSAVVALDVAERAFAKSELPQDRIDMATAFFAEGANSASGGAFNAGNCFKLDPNAVLDADLLKRVSNAPCYDSSSAVNQSTIGQTPYRADMFAVKTIYDRFQIPLGTTTGYMYDSFYDIFLTNSGDRDQQWGMGRKHFYYTFGSWYAGNPKPGMKGRDLYYGGLKRGSYWTTSPNSSTVTLGGTSRTTGSTANVTITDNNGGSLRNNDTVTIKNVNGQYWSATTGNVTTVTTPSSATTFTIVKIADTTQMIAGGDEIALRTSSGYYLTASTYGGNVTATSTTIGTNQKFVLDRTIND